MIQAALAPALAPLETVVCDLCMSDRAEPMLSTPDRNWPIQKNDLESPVPEQIWTVVRCQDCSLVYLNPRPKEVGNYYPSSYYAYDSGGSRPVERTWPRSLKQAARRSRVIWTLLRKTPLKAQLHDPLVDLVGWLPPGCILDVGCGSGGYLDALRFAGWKTQGVDISEQGVAEACRKGHQAWVGELERLELCEKSADVVRFSHVLEHTSSPRRTLQAARRPRPPRRLLRPNGLLIVEVPNLASIWTAAFRELGWLWDLPRHFYHFTAETLKQLAAQTGFHVRELRVRSTPGYILQSLAVARLDKELEIPAAGPTAADLLHQRALKTSLEPFCRELERHGEGNSLLLIAQPSP